MFLGMLTTRLDAEKACVISSCGFEDLNIVTPDVLTN